MNNDNNLKKISPFVEESLNLFKYLRFFNRKRILIALYRLRRKAGGIKIFYDFQAYLYKIKEINPSLSFFKDLNKYLKKNCSSNPWHQLFKLLNHYHYTKPERMDMILSEEEQLLEESLPLDDTILSILTLYLFMPSTLNQFFIEYPDFFLQPEETIILSKFRLLSPELKQHLLSYIQLL